MKSVLNGGQVDRYGVRAILSVDQFFPIIDKNLANLPYTASILEPLFKRSMNDEYINDPEDTMERWNVSTPEEADAYMQKMTLANQGLENFIFDTDTLVQLMGEYGDLRTFFIELYEKIVFPVWFAHWKAKGIVQTRKNVQNAYNNLKKASTKDLGNLVAWIGQALNTAHQSGSMLDYVPEDENFSVDINDESDNYSGEDLLQALTDGNFNNQWDKELREAGV